MELWKVAPLCVFPSPFLHPFLHLNFMEKALQCSGKLRKAWLVELQPILEPQWTLIISSFIINSTFFSASATTSLMSVAYIVVWPRPKRHLSGYFFPFPLSHLFDYLKVSYLFQNGDSSLCLKCPGSSRSLSLWGSLIP